MKVLTRLPAMRARAESLMADTFNVYSPDSGAKTTDADGFEVAGYADETATVGRIAGPTSLSRDSDARMVSVGGTERPVISAGLHIPVDADVPAMGEYGKGWEYVLVTLGPLTDPSLLNSRWLVVDAPAKSYATARRLDVVRIA
jgi:hypothetical protein